MKQHSYIIILFLILFISCKSKGSEDRYYLKIHNSTSYQVTMSIFEKQDTSVLKKYTILPNQDGYIDTSIYFSDGARIYTLIKGDGFRKAPYWKANSTLLRYKFGNFKESIFQNNPGAVCDTFTLNGVCNFVIREIEYFEATKTDLAYQQDIRTFYITQQQFEKADSI